MEEASEYSLNTLRLEADESRISPNASPVSYSDQIRIIRGVLNLALETLPTLDAVDLMTTPSQSQSFRKV